MRRAWLHMATAFVLMGAWAVFANRAHPMPRPVLAGAVQGAMSALITLCLKRVIDALAARLSGPMARVVPPVAAVAISLGVLVPVHTLAQTPDILRTIALPVDVTFLYATLYTLSLRSRPDA